jgi:hypothetical protein
MQDNKVYMLTNKMSNNFDILGYSDVVSTRCVDLKVFMLCYILTLTHGAISWKSSIMTLMALKIMHLLMWHVKRLLGRLHVKKFIPEIMVVDSIL